MYVINTETHIVNEWANTEINRLRLASGKYGVAEYSGETEIANGIVYEKGFAPVPTVEEVRQVRLAELNSAFEMASKEAHCRSSLGFEIDADETANRNVTSLLVALEATGEKTVPFCAYDNTFHEVTTDELKTLQLEIIAHARTLYARKWALREAIARAGTVEELEAIAITFA